MSKRIISNSRGKSKQLETKALQEQTRKMEEKLSDLKKFMELQKQKREQEQLQAPRRNRMNQSASRWKTASSTATKVPLKNYAQKILEEQKEAFKKYGINPKKIVGTKTFKPIIDMIKPPKPVENIPTAQEQSQPEVAYIGTKFGKAKIEVPMTSHQQQTVSEFLAEINLNQYIQTFEANGFDDLELLKDVTRQDLEKIGVSTGHQIKIIKNIKRIFDQQDGTQQVPLPIPPKAPSPVQSSESERVKRTSITNFKNKQPNKQQPDEDDYSQDFYDEAYITEQQPSTGNFLDGDYDEERNRKEFQEAVMAYRGIYKQIQQIQQEFSVQTELVNRQPSVCFTCYRSTLSPTYYLSKAFCSQKCLSVYSESISQCCPTCSKSFIKFEGICVEGVRYCCAKCGPKVEVADPEEMEALFIKWRLEQKQKQKETATFEDSLEM